MRQALFMLGQLSDDNIEWLIANGERQRAAAGTVLIEQGRDSGTVYIVLDGTLGIFVDGKMIATRSSGEILGEMSFIDDRLPTATVKAVEDSVLYTIPQAKLAVHLESDRDFAARFYRGISISLSSRMRELMAPPTEGDITSIDDITDDDALDSNVLESAYLAGLRFERILKRMMG
ncbi:MAG: cyclic nucleotide-binding domain-containing protein [Anaerolineae bacterium]|nr:cyclic nucleotide-binding domain-containing protein [Anaerolineae bacterium]